MHRWVTAIVQPRLEELRQHCAVLCNGLQPEAQLESRGSLMACTIKQARLGLVIVTRMFAIQMQSSLLDVGQDQISAAP
jgi:hypothetical protein